LSESEVGLIRNAAKNFIDVLYDKYYGNNSSGSGEETKPAVPSSVPTGVQATALSVDSIKVSWSGVSGISQYYVYASANENGTYGYMGSSTTTTYIIGGLTSGTTYYFKVAAVNDGGEGPLSSPAHATTQTVQTGGEGEIRIYNDSLSWNITWVGLYDVAENDWVDSESLEDDPLLYDWYYYWTEIPAGKEYWVAVRDNYGDTYTSLHFILSPNQILEVSYDGFGLSLIYDLEPSPEQSRTLTQSSKILKTRKFKESPVSPLR
jgi:hypothetical protein